jgi:hypothetical protein
MIRFALALALYLLTNSAWAIDGIYPTITSPADIFTRRTTLINQLWGTSTLPTTLPTVTTGISNPFPTYNVARVDQYVASMSNGQSNTSNLYIANSPNNGRVVIFNPGHQETCDWTAMASGYRIQPVLQALLAAGYSVFAMNMPACGVVASHLALFSAYGNTAMSYFLEPAVQAMNYWDANNSFSRYDMTGLSGGGWTATLLPAFDTRIKISIPVAGSWPGFNQGQTGGVSEGNCVNCSEQSWTNFYTVAGYLDFYTMSSYGPNRRQFQIVNYSDDCCFGNSEYISYSGPTYYDPTWTAYVTNYTVRVKQLERAVAPFIFDSTIDYIANQHQISANAQQMILSILASVGPGTAGGGRRLLHMW